MTELGRHILAVDDDGQIRELLTDYLGDAGFRVSAVADGATALAVLQQPDVDLVLLDIVLPDIDGLTLARKILEEHTIPIIMLTNRSDEIERVVGLEIGADDYVAKPFSPRELLARIKSVLRRIEIAQEAAKSEERVNNTVAFADWVLDMTSRRLLHKNGTELELTNSEFRLLSAFVEHPNRVLSRDQLLEFSRTDPDAVFDRSIDYLVLRLRRKIESDPRRPKILKTEHGVGYFFASPITRQ